MEEVLFRILIVGDSGVGKSCILLRFTQDTFDSDHNVTIGVEFATKVIQIFNKQIKLQIWDTAGQEGFRSITRSFYRSADGVILAYNLTERSSFDNCEFWLQEIRQNSPVDVVVYLLANQSDMINEGKPRVVTLAEGKNFAQKNRLSGFSECSAKAGTGVGEAFSEFCKVLFDKWKEKRSPAIDTQVVTSPQATFDLKPRSPRKKKRFC